MLALAEQNGIPFWPVTSILDLPAIIPIWRKIKAEAEAKARPELEARQARKAAAEADARHAAASR